MLDYKKNLTQFNPQGFFMKNSLTVKSLLLAAICSLGVLSSPVLAQVNPQPDYALALDELGPQAALGESDAQLLLGQMYLNGQGVPQNKTKALELFEKSAKQNNTEAQAALVKIYREDNKNLQSMKWLSVLATQDKEARESLAKEITGLSGPEQEQVRRFKEDFMKKQSPSI